MRPITAAARAWSRKLGPSTWPIGQADDPGPQEHRDVREHARDHPDDRVEPLDRDAERRGPVAALGGAADRGAEARAAHEQAERDEADRHEDDRQEVGGVEDHAREARS